MYRIVPFVLQSLVWVPVRIFLYSVFKFRIRGREHLRDIDRSRGIIFAVNHAAAIDPVIVAAAFPFLSAFYPFFYMSLDRSYYAHFKHLRHLTRPFFFKAWGSYEVLRGLKNYERALKQHIQILEDGGSLVLFIEGKRSHDGALGSARPGIGYLVERTDATVVPIALGGTFHLSVRSGIARAAQVSVSFLKPMRADELLYDAPAEPRERMYHVARKTLQAIGKELTT